MFCKYCGKEIQDNANFCRHCGKGLQAAVTGKEKQKPEKKKSVVVIVICVVLCLLLALAVGLIVVKGMRDNENPAQQEEQDEWDEPDREDDRGEGKDLGSIVAAFTGGAVKEASSESVEDMAEIPAESTEAAVEAPAESAEEAYEEAEASQYILPESNSRFLTKDDLFGFTQEDCRIARNELFARHGRIFQDEELQAYFESCDWYQGTVLPEDFDESVFNEYEFANRDLIVEYEKEQGYR